MWSALIGMRYYPIAFIKMGSFYLAACDCNGGKAPSACLVVLILYVTGIAGAIIRAIQRVVKRIFAKQTAGGEGGYLLQQSLVASIDISVGSDQKVAAPAFHDRQHRGKTGLRVAIVSIRAIHISPQVRLQDRLRQLFALAVGQRICYLCFHCGMIDKIQADAISAVL